MAYAKNYEFLFDQIRNRNASAYRITNESKSMVFAEGEELSPDAVINELQGILPNLTGLVYVTISQKSKLEKGQGGKNNDLVVPINLTAAASAPVAGIGSMAPVQDNSKLLAEMEERFNTKLQMVEMQAKHNAEMADLKRQLAEAKEVNPTFQELKPYIPQFIAGIFGTPQPAIAGTHEAHTPEHAGQPVEVSADDTARATDAINRLLAVDPDFINVLCRLAHMAETNSTMYNAAKSMLPPFP